MQELYHFGMDWLNGVLPVSDVGEVFRTLAQFSSKLAYNRWSLECYGKYNYAFRYCLDGQSSVQLMFNPMKEHADDRRCLIADMDCNNSGVFFSISGDGIRKLASMGQSGNSALNKLLFYFYRNGFKASRFDVYCDILDKKNKVVSVVRESFKYFRFPQVGKLTLTTNVQRKPNAVRMDRYVDENNKVYYNCTMGNHASNTFMFRCYNKREEVLNGRLDEYSESLLKYYDDPQYWWRMEYELHKKHAADYFNATMKQAEEDNKNIQYRDCFLTAFDRCFTPVVFSYLKHLKNIRTLTVSVDWSEFANMISNCPERFILSNSTLPYVEMSRVRLNKYIKHNSSFVYALFTAVLFQPDLIYDVLAEGQDRFHKKVNIFSFYENEIRNVEQLTDEEIDDYINVIKSYPINKKVNDLNKKIKEVTDPIEQAKLLSEILSLKGVK